MIRKNTNKFPYILFLIVLLLSCTFNKTKYIPEIGDKVMQSTIVQDDTVNYHKNIYRIVRTSYNKNITYFIDKNNIIIFYKEENLNEDRFNKYFKFFKKKYPGQLKKIDSSIFSVNFICIKYLWSDSSNKDFVILSSCKNIKDTLTKLGDNWNIEVGNDSIINEYRNNGF